MKATRKEVLGLLLGGVLGAVPFVAIWLLSGVTAEERDLASLMWGFPAIVLAPFASLLGAIIGVALSQRR